MAHTLCPTATPRYHELFAARQLSQPLDYFLLEKLLTARADSMFPTNGAGPDEDVNVYLAHILSRFLAGDSDNRVESGSTALFNPPNKNDSNRSRSEYYRANGDHRLLQIGRAHV